MVSCYGFLVALQPLAAYEWFAPLRKESTIEYAPYKSTEFSSLECGFSGCTEYT